MLLYILVGLLLLVSAGAKAVQDSVAHRNGLKKLGPWWDSNESWKRKWKPTTGPTGELLYKDEAFFGSSTFLVLLSDAWHFFGMLRDSCWQAALVLLTPFPWYYQLLAFVAIKVAYGTAFQILYTLLNKKAS